MATDQPQTVGRTAGVWYRVFAGGAIFMNPKGNGVKTVTLASIGLPTNMNAIANISGSTGDPAINTGLSVSSITLQDRDGRALKF